MIRILNAEPAGYCDEARMILRSIGEITEESVTQEELVRRVEDFDVVIIRLGLRITRQVLEAGRHLKVVVTATTGLDHIDLDAACKRGVTILSLREEAEFLREVPATAEHTWALLLALARRLPWAFDSVRQSRWDRDGFRGRDLRGKRLGILGLGRVGEQVAQFGLAFGMKLGAYDRYRQEWVEGVHRFTTEEEFLAWSEVLSVHVPLNKETEGLLNRERLRLLPWGAWVVNTARGAIIDENALVSLLEEGYLAGAALDVLKGDTDPQARQQSPLLTYVQKHTNLLITPHIGGATIESMARTELFMAQKLWRYLASINPVATVP